MPWRTLAFFVFGALAGVAGAASAAAEAAARSAEPAPVATARAATVDAESRIDYARVDVAPTKTSIYVGTVSMTMPAFARRDGRFETTYVAKVFPYFFYNEQGTLAVEVSDEQLRALARGEAIQFKGRAVRDDGAERRVEGKATPADAASGRLKVRVFVSKRVELIFNTTYRFMK